MMEKEAMFARKQTYLLESFCPGNSGYSLSSGAGAAASAIMRVMYESVRFLRNTPLFLFSLL